MLHVIGGSLRIRDVNQCPGDVSRVWRGEGQTGEAQNADFVNFCLHGPFKDQYEILIVPFSQMATHKRQVAGQDLGAARSTSWMVRSRTSINLRLSNFHVIANLPVNFSTYFAHSSRACLPF